MHFFTRVLRTLEPLAGIFLHHSLESSINKMPATGSIFRSWYCALFTGIMSPRWCGAMTLEKTLYASPRKKMSTAGKP